MSRTGSFLATQLIQSKIMKTSLHHYFVSDSLSALYEYKALRNTE